jgi:hypothetical protein
VHEVQEREAEPNAVMPYTDKLEPKRAKLRMERLELMLTKSSTERLDPSRATPYELKQLPSCAKLRTDKELPRLTKSKTESDEPRRPTPKIEQLDPNRM